MQDGYVYIDGHRLVQIRYLGAVMAVALQVGDETRSYIGPREWGRERVARDGEKLTHREMEAIHGWSE